MSTAPSSADVLQVSLLLPTRDHEQRLLRSHEIDFGCRPKVFEGPGGARLITAFVTAAQVAELKAAGFSATVVANHSERLRQLQAQQRKEPRFTAGPGSTRGLGTLIYGLEDKDR